MFLTENFIAEFYSYCKNHGWEFDKSSSEFTFQFRLGWYLNHHFSEKYLIDFEVNLKLYNAIKKEADILIKEKNSVNKSVIELKFIKDESGYDISIFKFCEDIKFLEQLSERPEFDELYCLAFSIVDKVYFSPKKVLVSEKHKEFYKMFRDDKKIKTEIRYGKNIEIPLKLKSEYNLVWNNFGEKIKVCLVKVK